MNKKYSRNRLQLVNYYSANFLEQKVGSAMSSAMIEPATARRGLFQIAELLQVSRDDPDNGEPHAGVTALLNDLGRHTDAIGAGLMATRLSPASPRAQAELGRALFLAGEIEAALEPCARAVSIAPRNLGAMVTFGAVLFTLGRLPQALEAALEAVAIDPNHFQARANLALALEGVGRLDEAEAQARKALALDPDSPHARHNLAGLRLSRGKLDKESWSLYEARLQLTAQTRTLDVIPRWTGGPVKGQIVLLHAEQGFGDVIQFARYAPAVKQRGATVILAVADPLVRLFERLDGVDQVVAAGQLPPFDVFCPVASLPGILATTIGTIPAATPYLTPSPQAVRRFHPCSDGRLKVGLAWAGNPGFVHDRFRSMAAGTLATLADVDGVAFHSLQKGGTPPFPMADRMAEVADFADTAGLIAGLDLVITVDTAVAHLAGALGRPVWLMSRFMGCWRWLRDREDSPWYPTMRIFRQPRPGDWGAVVAAIRAALVERVDGMAPDATDRPPGWTGHPGQP